MNFNKKLNQFEKKLSNFINAEGIDDALCIPDYILAKYALDCMLSASVLMIDVNKKEIEELQNEKD